MFSPDLVYNGRIRIFSLVVLRTRLGHVDGTILVVFSRHNTAAEHGLAAGGVIAKRTFYAAPSPRSGQPQHSVTCSSPNREGSVRQFLRRKVGFVYEVRSNTKRMRDCVTIGSKTLDSNGQQYLEAVTAIPRCLTACWSGYASNFIFFKPSSATEKSWGAWKPRVGGRGGQPKISGPFTPRSDDPIVTSFFLHHRKSQWKNAHFCLVPSVKRNSSGDIFG